MNDENKKEANANFPYKEDNDLSNKNDKMGDGSVFELNEAIVLSDDEMPLELIDDSYTDTDNTSPGSIELIHNDHHEENSDDGMLLQNQDSIELIEDEVMETDSGANMDPNDLDANELDYNDSDSIGSEDDNLIIEVGLPLDRLNAELDNVSPDGYKNYTDQEEKLPAALDKIEELSDKIDKLHQEFENKIKFDEHKNSIIDKLHQELQEYKEDIIKKHVLSLIMDIVKVIDDIRKWSSYYRAEKPENRNPKKLFDFLESIPSELEDIFEYQGVKSFVLDSQIFDPAKQRVLKKIKTQDPIKDKMVCKSLRPGYEWNDKIIRREMVAVYLYQPDQSTE